MEDDEDGDGRRREKEVWFANKVPPATRKKKKDEGDGGRWGEDTLPRPLRPHNTSSEYLTHLPLPPLTPPPAHSYHYVPVAPQSRGGADHDPLLVPAKVSSDDGVGDGGAGEPMGEVTGDS